jgi:predicted TIM-barrel fold metal-dependent hydrolase
MIDAYMHLDMRAAAPLADLRQRLDEAGLDGALVVETWDGRNVELLARAEADRLDGIGVAYCYRGQSRAELQSLLARQRVWCLRADTSSLARDDYPAELVARERKWLLPHAEAGIAPLLPSLVRWSQASPDLKIYVPHLGWPRRDGADETTWLEAMTCLANIKTTVIGVSALAHFSNLPFPHEDVRPFVDRLCALFGAGRVVIGSDYPNSGAAMYQAHHALATRWVSAALPLWNQHDVLRP